MRLRIIAAIAFTVMMNAIGVNALPMQINNLEPIPVVDSTSEQPVITENPQTASKQPEEAPLIVEVQSEEPKVPSVNTSEAEAKAFIYSKESGNNPLAKNSIGCFGIGQDCNGIVENRCGGDYNCQDTFFTQYMQRRYGSWQAAKSFWISRVPIDGRDVGNWW